MGVKQIGFGMVLLLAGVLLPWEAQAQIPLPPPGCSPAPTQPSPGVHPAIEMNTVQVDDFVKTIKVEKEVFVCRDAQCTCFDPPDCRKITCPPPNRIVDVQLFTEVIERNQGDTIHPVDKRFEVITCEKDIGTAKPMGCRRSTPQPLAAPPAVNNCSLDPEGQPFLPIAMNTVVVGDFVKTIKAQKEVFSCGTSVIVDFNTFTEIIERKKGDTIQPVQKSIELAICRKELGVDPTGRGTVAVTGCFASPPVPLP